MPLKTWRFITLVLASLSVALSFCHLMEMPVRLQWEPALWMATTNFGGLYLLFGRIGAVIDTSAWLAAVALVVLVRHRRPAFLLTSIGAALFVLAHAAWWLFVFPANRVMAGWEPGIIPRDFFEVREQWEYAHAAIALMKIGGLAALLISILTETPRATSAEVHTDAP